MFKHFIGLCLPIFQKITGRTIHQVYDIEYIGKNIYLIPKEKHESTLIWMHGLGDQADSYLYLFTQENGLIFSKSTKIILLEAPERKVTINYGQISNSWFDIRGMDFRGEFEKLVSFEDIEDSKKIIDNVLSEESKIINSEKIFIGGFSQGCSMALHCGLNFNKKLGGIIGLSGFLFPTTIKSDESKKTPVVLFHGDADYMIPLMFAKKSYNQLTHHSQYLIFKSIPNLAHTIDDSLLREIQNFMESQIQSNSVNMDQQSTTEETTVLRQDI